MEAETPAPVKSVAIVGMGSSDTQYKQDYESAGRKLFTTETWVVNSGAYWYGPEMFTHAIALDDFERDEKMDGGKHAEYVRKIVGCGKPVIGPVLYDRWSNVEAYPWQEVRADIWPDAKSLADIIPDIENTITGAVALAIQRKFDVIRLYGADFCFTDDAYLVASIADELEPIKPRWFVFHDQRIVKERRPREPGLDGTMWMLGVAHARGIKVKVCRGSTLMNQDRGRYVYGPQEPPEIFPSNEKEEALKQAMDDYNEAVRRFNSGNVAND